MGRTGGRRAASGGKISPPLIAGSVAGREAAGREVDDGEIADDAQTGEPRDKRTPGLRASIRAAGLGHQSPQESLPSEHAPGAADLGREADDGKSKGKALGENSQLDRNYVPIRCGGSKLDPKIVRVAANAPGALDSPDLGAFDLSEPSAPQITPKCPPNNTLEDKGLTDWWDFSEGAEVFDPGEWGEQDLWRLEKKRETYIYVLRFVKQRITRTGGPITPAIKERLEQRPGRGRWQGSRADARRLKHFAEHLATRLDTTSEGGAASRPAANTARAGVPAARSRQVSVSVDRDRDVSDLPGYIN